MAIHAALCVSQCRLGSHGQYRADLSHAVNMGMLDRRQPRGFAIRGGPPTHPGVRDGIGNISAHAVIAQ